MRANYGQGAQPYLCGVLYIALYLLRRLHGHDLAE